MSVVSLGCSGGSVHGVIAFGRLVGIPVTVGCPPVLIVLVDGWMMIVVGSQDSEFVIVPIGGTLVNAGAEVDDEVAAGVLVEETVEDSMLVGSTVVDSAVLVGRTVVF